MSFQSVSQALRRILDKTVSRWALLSLAVVAAFGAFLRCLHLFSHQNYYVLSADSYFFQWLAQRVMAGEGPPLDAPSGAIYTLHTGLAYPLAYIAKAISYIFSLSSTDALDVTAKFSSPLLGVISLIVVYLAASRIFNRRVALFSALTWALMLNVVFIGASGYLDRDGLSVLLIMSGAFVFYLSEGWQLHIGRMDFGWLAAGLVVLGLEALLYLEWVFVGPVLLLVVLIAYFLVKLLLGYASHVQKRQNVLHRLADALKESSWRTFSLIIGVNIIFILVNSGSSGWLRFMINAIGAGGESGVAEMTGISLGDLLSFQLFLIPVVLGIYISWKKRSKGAIFFTSWFLVLLILSLFAKRVLFYTMPAVCLLSGIGLSFLWGWQRQGQSQYWKRAGVIALVCLLVLISFLMAAPISSNSMVAVDKEWQDALTYVRDETPKEAVVMTNWGWGYWILDLGQRRPVVDNGYYYYNDEKLRDVALTYLATEPTEAAKIMEKYGADYLIFSKLDLDVAGTIMGWAGLHENADAFPEDSLITRTLSGEFELGGGLEVVYRSVPQGEVFILGLTN